MVLVLNPTKIKTKSEITQFAISTVGIGPVFSHLDLPLGVGVQPTAATSS